MKRYSAYLMSFGFTIVFVAATASAEMPGGGMGGQQPQSGGMMGSQQSS